MTTTKVLLDTRRKKKDGTYPLVIRIFNNGKYRDIGLKCSLKEAEFDSQSQKVKKTHKNHELLNTKINQTLLKVQEESLKFEISDQVSSAHLIKNATTAVKASKSFITYSEGVISQMRIANRNGNANAYRDALNAFKKYSGIQDPPMKAITYELIGQLETNMLAAGLKRNAIACYFRSLRAIINRAIKEKLMDRAKYPFESFKIKTESTTKRNISKSEMQAIMALEIKKNTTMWHSRNYFLLSFNLIGISFADMATLKYSDISNGRISYRRKKTHKLYNLRLTSTALELINLYKSPDRTYILPVIPENMVGNQVEERKYIQYGTKTTNKYISRIGKLLKIDLALTTYVARHSWATIAKRMGYSKDLIAEALGHEFGNKVTGIYLDNFDQDVIDDMNSTVCRFN